MVKDFNVIINELAFFDLPIKTEEEAYENIIDISRSNEYTAGSLLDYDYFNPNSTNVYESSMSIKHQILTIL